MQNLNNACLIDDFIPPPTNYIDTNVDSATTTNTNIYAEIKPRIATSSISDGVLGEGPSIPYEEPQYVSLDDDDVSVSSKSSSVRPKRLAPPPPIRKSSNPVTSSLSSTASGAPVVSPCSSETGVTSALIRDLLFENSISQAVSNTVEHLQETENIISEANKKAMEEEEQECSNNYKSVDIYASSGIRTDPFILLSDLESSSIYSKTKKSSPTPQSSLRSSPLQNQNSPTEVLPLDVIQTSKVTFVDETVNEEIKEEKERDGETLNVEKEENEEDHKQVKSNNDNQSKEGVSPNLDQVNSKVKIEELYSTVKPKKDREEDGSVSSKQINDDELN